MDAITVRELRNHGREVMDRVLTGEKLIVTRDGEAVAELRPVRRSGLAAATLLERWSHLPDIDAAALRQDIDSVLDSSL